MDGVLGSARRAAGAGGGGAADREVGESGEKCTQAEGSGADLFFLNVFPTSRGAGPPPSG